MEGRNGRLTQRQAEVLQKLSLGIPADSAAAQLGIGPETFKTHRQNAMRALGAKTTVEAVAAAIRRGEIN